MAVTVTTQRPNALLSSIKAAIDNGGIETWSYDSDGDFTHSPEQWKNKAWFRPSIDGSTIVFKILAPKGTAMSKALYAVYHGRFIEMLLAHFDLQFSNVAASALPSRGDIVKS